MLSSILARSRQKMLSLARRAVAGRRRGLSSVPLGEVPVIDLTPLRGGGDPPRVLVDDVAKACASWGFFQVVNHGLDSGLRARFEEQMRQFFLLPTEVKRAIKRDGSNARGWYDDELTKQRRDWKQGLDIGVPASRDWYVSRDLLSTMGHTHLHGPDSS